ncbi:hypothetical protein AX16_002423 [Volvariella volvacea WC 439]|nr:hypothetical protein AX16_002423 [Volvariella volvacea WC 439]
MPVIKLVPRGSDDSSPTNPIYIAGYTVIGVIVMGLLIWLALRMYRRHAVASRASQRGAAFLSVRGLVPEDQPEKMQTAQTSIGGPTFIHGTFSRGQMDTTIVLPGKTFAPPNSRSRQDVLDYHRQSGNFPKPFAPKPFSFALAAGTGTDSPRASGISLGSPKRLSFSRSSFLSMSSGPSNSRFSVISATSTIDSSGGTTRKVRQLFTPVLPDELLLTNVGEQLTVIQSFDDGWCVVGREGSIFATTAKSLFKPTSAEPEIEIGAVPAWCFMKPVKGLKAERPIRGSSLGITVQMQAPGVSSRNELMSWSNF